MCAAGTMPGELHKLWKAAPAVLPHGIRLSPAWATRSPARIGIKMAEPDRDVICMVGDGSYMMANSELATAVMLGIPFTVVLTDNRGYGCINRLQMATGGAEFNNLLKDARRRRSPPHRLRRPRRRDGRRRRSRSARIAELEAALGAAPRGRAAPTSSSSTPTRIRHRRRRPLVGRRRARGRRPPSEVDEGPRTLRGQRPPASASSTDRS